MSVVLAFLRSFGADVEADSGVADGVWLVVVDMEKGSDPPAGSLSPSVSRRQGCCRWRWWCRVVIASLLSRQLKVLLDAPKGFAKEVTLRYFSYYLLHLIQNTIIFSILNSLEPTPSLLYFLVNIGLVV